MATVVLSAAGAAIGGSVGGSLAGLSSVAIGRAVGATLGKVLDQRLLGQGSDVVEHGKVDRFRLTNSGEGSAIAQLYGRMRLGGHVIWASDFLESKSESGGGKGAPSKPKTREYSYSVSLALAVCEGEIHVEQLRGDRECQEHAHGHGRCDEWEGQPTGHLKPIGPIDCRRFNKFVVDADDGSDVDDHQISRGLPDEQVLTEVAG